ncbi:MAG: hypothetical protein SFU98_01650 [Leptospiraceae bacterium]|nr:hypothetical protein [Leptospiraceae bacterium]
MKKILLILVLIFFLSCSSTQETNSTSSDAPATSPSVIDALKKKAESEEGKKFIEMAKEKAKDKEFQEKVKGMLPGKKEEKK